MRALEVQEYLHLYKVADSIDPMSSLSATIEAARRELVTDAIREAMRIAGAHAADAAHFLHPSELPGATTGVVRALCRWSQASNAAVCSGWVAGYCVHEFAQAKPVCRTTDH
jgi:hypothetical protein